MDHIGMAAPAAATPSTLLFVVEHMNGEFVSGRVPVSALEREYRYRLAMCLCAACQRQQRSTTVVAPHMWELP